MMECEKVWALMSELENSNSAEVVDFESILYRVMEAHACSRVHDDLCFSCDLFTHSRGHTEGIYNQVTLDRNDTLKNYLSKFRSGFE